MSTSAISTSLGGYASLIRHNRNFRYLWFGEIVSFLGIGLISSRWPRRSAR